nr:hypothetical protein Q903MT_gene13 [Picea sitchensis]
MLCVYHTCRNLRRYSLYEPFTTYEHAFHLLFTFFTAEILGEGVMPNLVNYPHVLLQFLG